MNLIIDCNQASRLPTDRGKTRSHSLIVSPAVLAEIFLRTDPNPTLNRIRHYHFTIGLEIADVMFELSRLSSEEISSFQPFYSQRNTYQEDYEGLIEGIYKPTLDHVNWAAGMKARHRQSCEGLTAQSEPARKEIREAVRAHRRVSEKTGSPAEEKPSNYKDLLPYDSSKEFVYDLLTQSLVKFYGLNVERVAQIFDAVMTNPYLGRLLRCLHAYSLGRAGGWRDQENNFYPSQQQDDVTDILLPLYAGDDDAIVTEDKMLSRLISLIEVGAAPVLILKASEI